MPQTGDKSERKALKKQLRAERKDAKEAADKKEAQFLEAITKQTSALSNIATRGSSSAATASRGSWCTSTTLKNSC